MNRFERIASKIAADEENSLDGMKNAKARREVQMVFRRNTPKGILRDNYWRGPHQVFDALNSAAFDWAIMETFYSKNREGVPESKTWKFEIYFTNDRGRKTTLYGTLVAAGAGTVDDPLDAYDVVVYVS